MPISNRYKMLMPLVAAAAVIFMGCQDMAIQYYNMGIDAIEKGDTTAAVDYFEKSVQIEPNDADAHFNLGVALYGVGEYRRALAEFEIAGQTYPADPALHINLAETYTALGRFHAAKKEYEYALRRDPNNADALTGLGSLLLKTNQYEAAQEYLQQALAIRPSHGLAHISMGWVYLRTGRETEATHYFYRGLRSLPNSIDGRLGLAESFRLRGNYEDALEEYRTVYAKDRGNREAMLGMGICNTELGNLGQAKELLEKARGVDPDNPRVYRALGNYYLAKEMFTESVGNFRMAIQIDVNERESYVGLGRALDAAGLHAEAADAFERALAKKPDDAALLYRLGQVYAELDETDRAIACLEKGLTAPSGTVELERKIRALIDQLEDQRESDLESP